MPFDSAPSPHGRSGEPDPVWKGLWKSLGKAAESLKKICGKIQLPELIGGMYMWIDGKPYEAHSLGLGDPSDMRALPYIVHACEVGRSMDTVATSKAIQEACKQLDKGSIVIINIETIRFVIVLSAANTEARDYFYTWLHYSACFHGASLEAVNKDLKGNTYWDLLYKEVIEGRTEEPSLDFPW